MKVYIGRLKVINVSRQLQLEHNHRLIAIANHAIEHLPSIGLQNYPGRSGGDICRTKNTDALDWLLGRGLIFTSQDSTPLRVEGRRWK